MGGNWWGSCGDGIAVVMGCSGSWGLKWWDGWLLTFVGLVGWEG